MSLACPLYFCSCYIPLLLVIVIGIVIIVVIAIVFSGLFQVGDNVLSVLPGKLALQEAHGAHLADSGT